jgi:hypothetical protein
MKRIQLALLLCVVLFATGCPNTPKVDFANPNSFVSKINAYLQDAQLKCDCLSRQHSFNEKEKRCNDDAFSGGIEEAKIVRNNAIDLAVPVIDGMYSEFINNIENRREKTDFIADVIELASSAAIGSIKGPQRSIQIIGIALTAFRGGRKSSDINFYKQQTTPILIDKMDGNRAEVLAIITLNQVKPIGEYSMGKAIKNLADYYNAGTLVRAFNQLSHDTANQTQTSETAARVVRGEDITPSKIRTVQETDLSLELLRQRRILAKRLRDALSMAVPTATAGDTVARTAEIAKAKTDRDEKVKAVRDDLGEVWTAITQDDKFKPIVAQMKTDTALTNSFNLVEATATTDELAAPELLKLINVLTTKIKDNPELRASVLGTLQTVNK